MSNLIGTSLGRYHILEQLGEGGMATVYKAYDTRLERDVALKVIRREVFPPKQLERMLIRFKREAKVVANLKHPNIVKVLDFGEEDGIPFLVMDFIPGGTLKERLKQYQGRHFPWKEAARFLAPIARALGYAHQEDGKIIHRDVKPANILITSSGIPMLSDFGIAKVLELDETLELTNTGVGIGTPEYMAPEQASKNFDHRTDIYALGTVFYEMLTGRRPYEADTPLAVMIKKNTDPLPLPTKIISDLPVQVERILLRALAKNPNHRYSNMNDFALALENLAKGILPDSPAPRTRPITVPIHQISAKLGLGLIGAIILCAAGFLILWFFFNRFIRPQPDSVTQVNEVESTSELPPTLDTPTGEIPITQPLRNIPIPIETKTSTTDNSVFVLVPEGEFIMGSDPDDPYFWGAEMPKHDVYLNAFWIQITEVTNSMYRACVDEGSCSSPSETSSRTHKDYFENESYNDYPAINVTYKGAVSYCAWVGGRLPTEAEWEKAARGTDGSLFPWGNDDIQDNFANLCDANCTNLDTPEFGLNDGYADVAPVGSFPAGTSPYGALDMAGNVWEWIRDWYDEKYYASSPARNPENTKDSGPRVLRGGSWNYGASNVRASNRWSIPDYRIVDVGFRCAR